MGEPELVDRPTQVLRIKSGDASASASPTGPAGSTMCGAVIVMVLEDSEEG
jgi:hypothetical protein